MIKPLKQLTLSLGPQRSKETGHLSTIDLFTLAWLILEIMPSLFSVYLVSSALKKSSSRSVLSPMDSYKPASFYQDTLLVISMHQEQGRWQPPCEWAALSSSVQSWILFETSSQSSSWKKSTSRENLCLFEHQWSSVNISSMTVTDCAFDEHK